jgi:predicted integral membrane protein DUF2269
VNLVPAASAYEIVLAVHIMAVVVAFGVTFAYPVMFAVAARTDPGSLPVLHRIEYAIERRIVNPVLVIVLGAGIYLASDGHHWSEFFVQWGFAVVIVIGALVGAVMIPTSKKAEQAAERDIAAAGDGEVVLGEEYQGLVRRLQLVGTTLSLLVLVTILFMVVKP